jgi:hypothetical protein
MQIDHVSRILLDVQNNCGQWFFFLNVIFLYQMCTIPFQNLKMILVVMSIKAKALEIDKIHFRTH